jgi:hypothetical protein
MSQPVQARRGALLLALYVMLFVLLVSIMIVVFIARAPPPESERGAGVAHILRNGAGARKRCARGATESGSPRALRWHAACFFEV